MSWFYMSFVGEVGFLGSAYVKGVSSSDALARATTQGINPGGEIVIAPVPLDLLESNVPARFREVLLTLEDLRKMSDVENPSGEELGKTSVDMVHAACNPVVEGG